MLVLVMGGAASGKSKLAESYCEKLGTNRVYLATMTPYGQESHDRIARHRLQRAELGFDTVERYHSLQTIQLERHYQVALLECMGNLVANQLFDVHTPPWSLVDEVMAGIAMLLRQVDHLVVVSNAVFGGHQQYYGNMGYYINGLSRINSRLAATADLVVEAVCGLPLYLKGQGEL